LEEDAGEHEIVHDVGEDIAVLVAQLAQSGTKIGYSQEHCPTGLLALLVLPQQFHFLYFDVG